MIIKISGVVQFIILSFLLFGFANSRSAKSSFLRPSRDVTKQIEDIDEERNSSSYIIGGRTAKQGRYPWTARLEVYFSEDLKNGFGACGGYIYNKHYVLTAAHCFKDCGKNLMALYVRICIGDYDQEISDGEKCYWADSWKFNNFTFCDNQNRKNDIALLKVKKRMRVPYWGPKNVGNTNFAWIPKNKQYNGNGTLTGWGVTNPNPTETPVFPDQMKVIELRILSVEQCQKYYPEMDDSQFCAGDEEGQNSCRGDSGGPLVFAEKGWYTIIGISSYGPLYCAFRGRPNVFTRVAYFLSWIEKNAGSAGTPTRKNSK